ARLHARPHHARRIHSRGSRYHSSQATRQDKKPEDGGNENGGSRVPGTDGRARETRVPKAEARLHLFDIQRIRRPASVGRPGKHSTEIDRPGNVRVIPNVLRLYPRL